MATLLKRAGLPAMVNFAPDETVDDEVVIAFRGEKAGESDSLAVQCGYGYYCLNFWNEAEESVYQLLQSARATDMVGPAKEAFAKYFPEKANAQAQVQA